MYTNSICEGIPIGSVLRTITATDCDIGHNAIIHYSIESTEGLGLFTIDETTGVLSIAGTIDYERTGPSIVVNVRQISKYILYSDGICASTGCCQGPRHSTQQCYSYCKWPNGHS